MPEVFLGPEPRPMVAVLPGHEEVAQGAQVVLLRVGRRRVLPPDGPDGRGCHKQGVHPVGLNHTEELARIRRTCR